MDGLIQQHLAGGAHSKADAKAAWQKFTENVGMIARAGANVFELVARISGIFG